MLDFTNSKIFKISVSQVASHSIRSFTEFSIVRDSDANHISGIPIMKYQKVQRRILLNRYYQVWNIRECSVEKFLDS